MGLLGISLIVAGVVLVIIRPPAWFWHWRGFGGAAAVAAAITDGTTTSSSEVRRNDRDEKKTQDAELKRYLPSAGQPEPKTKASTIPIAAAATSTATRRHDVDRAAMPPPPPPPALLTITPPSAAEAPSIQEPESPTTPKASATPSTQPVPSFTLSDDAFEPTTPSASSSSMPPPPLPPSRAPGPRIPSISQFPAPNSAQRARGPAPNRGLAPASSSSAGLAPPPTLSSKPSKPSRKVILTPGHSPLDWARISGPNSDLRGVPSSTPYLRVTPSMLKAQTGRKGKDAWMALNGKVYNITPYAKFHPGGVPELMRGAAKDGTKLFGEIHPWVNYEAMLTACLVGLLVEEPVAGKENEMDKMD